MYKLLIFFVILIFTSINVTANPAKRPMTVDDYLNMVRIKNVMLSPDGTKVFYGLEKVDWSKNGYRCTYYLCGSGGRDKRVFFRKETMGENFKFSPDGKYISFISKVDKKKQIFLIPVDGGEAQQLSHHQVSVDDYQWFNSAQGILFTADQARTPKEQKEYENGADAIFIDEAANGKEIARYSRLWAFDLSSKKEMSICQKNLVISEFDISGDGKKVVFSATPDTRTNYPFLAELYIVKIDGTCFQRITHNGAPEEGPKWSPDGKTIIFHAPYLSPQENKYDLRTGYFWLYNSETKRFRRLNSQNHGEIRGGVMAWSTDGRYYYFNELWGTSTNLFRLNIKTDKLEAMTDVKGTLWPKSFSADVKTMAYTYQDFKNPADVYLADLRLKKTIRITDANPWIKKEIMLSNAETLKWKSKKDGLEIGGMFFSPGKLSKSKKLPMILHIHGGPSGVIENLFRPEFHLFGGVGFAVLGPNYRGSTGYGDQLLRGLMGQVGDGEHADIMSGVDYVIHNRNIDPERMAVRGWSWGGVSTGYLITHVHRFKAASAGAGVYNWAAETGPGYNFDVSLWYIGGTPWDDPEEWALRSAITFVKNVKTPTILFHGASDTTSSVGQSLMFFTALRDIGRIPVRYIKFLRQGHGLREPRAKRIHLTEEIRWFKKYVEGEVWNSDKRKK